MANGSVGPMQYLLSPRHVDTEYWSCGLLLHLEAPIDNYPKKEYLKVAQYSFHKIKL